MMETMPRTDVGIDFSRFDPRSRVREEADAARAQEAVHSPLEKRRLAREAANWKKLGLRRSKLFMASLACVLLAVTMLFGIVFSTMQLSALTAEANRVRRQIGALSGQEANLRAQVENRIDLAEIERIATLELGMIKPRGEQIVYVDTSGGDFAVVYQGEDTGAFAGMRRMLSSLF
jgi:cell division protein FtsL